MSKKKAEKETVFKRKFIDIPYVIDDEFFRSENVAAFRFGSTSIGHKRVYVPELALILCRDSIPAFNRETQKQEVIAGNFFWKSYIEGFEEGQKYFIKNYSVDSTFLFTDGGKKFVKSLHGNFFHEHEFSTILGWRYWVNSYPLIISHKIIKEYGFYAGIFSQLHLLVKKYPTAFEDFNKCEDSTQGTKWKYGEEEPKAKTIKASAKNLSFILKPGLKNKIEFKDVLGALTNGGLVSTKTTLPNFKKIFSGNEVKDKIEWTGSIPALHDFVSRIWKFGASKQGIWKTAVNCFSKNGELNERQLQETKGAKPSDLKTIEKAIKHFTPS